MSSRESSIALLKAESIAQQTMGCDGKSWGCSGLAALTVSMRWIWRLRKNDNRLATARMRRCPSKTDSLRANFYGGAVRDGIPDLIHFGVGDGNAAFGPVDEALGGAEPAEAVADAVDHDVSAGIDAASVCRRGLRWCGIAD